MPFTDCFGDILLQAVQQGHMRKSVIDVAVQRVLTQKFALGLFEHPYVDAEAVAFDTPDQRQLARQIAQKSLVLLKNDGDLLPLSPQIESLAIIGPNADSVRNLFGDYSYPSHVESLREMKRQNNVFNMPLPGDFDADDDFVSAVSVLAAIRARVSPTTRFVMLRAAPCATVAGGLR